MLLRTIVYYYQTVFLAPHHYPVGIDMQMLGYNFIVNVEITNQNQLRQV